MSIRRKEQQTRIDEVGRERVHLHAIDCLRVEHLLRVERIEIGVRQRPRKLKVRHVRRPSDVDTTYRHLNSCDRSLLVEYRNGTRIVALPVAMTDCCLA